MQPEQEPNIEDPESSNAGTTVAIAAGASLLLIGGAVAVVFVMRGKSSKKRPVKNVFEMNNVGPTSSSSMHSTMDNSTFSSGNYSTYAKPVVPAAAVVSGSRHRVDYAYDGTGDDVLSFTASDIIIVEEQPDSQGWAKGHCEKSPYKSGYFPYSYLGAQLSAVSRAPPVTKPKPTPVIAKPSPVAAKPSPVSPLPAVPNRAMQKLPPKPSPKPDTPVASTSRPTTTLPPKPAPRPAPVAAVDYSAKPAVDYSAKPAIPSRKPPPPRRQ
jgi:hypothetical protein